MFSCLTLFNLAKNKVRSVYRDHWSETNVLPIRIQRDLLSEWLQCEEPMDNIAAQMEDATWRELQPITPQTFVWLMSHPQEYPAFAFEKNHIVFNYYIKLNYQMKHDRDGVRLCSDCFSRTSKYYQPYSANLWLRKNEVYKKVTGHTVVHGDDLLEHVIWEGKNWCDECTCAPLFNVLSTWECEEEYDYHVYKKRAWAYDSDDSDDEPPAKYNIYPLVGNRLSEQEFNTWTRTNMIE